MARPAEDPEVLAARELKKQKRKEAAELRSLLDDMETEHKIPTDGHQDKKGRRVYTRDEIVQHCQAINHIYTQVYKSLPESPGAWNRQNGIVARIRQHLMLPSTRGVTLSVMNTLRVINVNKEKGVNYLGERQPRKEWEHYFIKKQG